MDKLREKKYTEEQMIRIRVSIEKKLNDLFLPTAITEEENDVIEIISDEEINKLFQDIEEIFSKERR